MAWREAPIEGVTGRTLVDRLKAHCDGIAVDVVVMTQACDLEEGKVVNVTLCAHSPLAEWKRSWRDSMKAKSQVPTDKAWRGQCEDIKNGYVWNLSMLNAGGIEDIQLEHRIVDFHEVFTVPREFLESLLRERDERRLRLLPPYREHLSQAFARFYMRVGLPVAVATAW